MGSKKTGLSGGQAAQVYKTSLSMYWYMYGRRIVMFFIMVLVAFAIGWYIHRKGHFPSVTMNS